MSDDLRALTCPTCTGPLDVAGAPDGLVRCAYCGTAVRVAMPGQLAPRPAPEPEGPQRQVVPFVADEAAVVGAVRRRLRSGATDAPAARVLVPAWIGRGRGTTTWRADVPRGRPRPGQPPAMTSERDSLAKVWDDLCVLGAEGPWGEVAERAARRAIKAEPMSDEALQDAMIVEGTRTLREGRKRVRERIEALQEDEVRRLLPRGARDLVASTSVEEVELEPVLLPVWAVAVPRPSGDPVKAYVDDGSLEVVIEGGDAPVRRRRRRSGGGGLGCVLALVIGGLIALSFLGFAVLVLLLTLAQG